MMCNNVVAVHRFCVFFFFFQAEDGIRDYKVTGVQTCALPISEQIFVERGAVGAREEALPYNLNRLKSRVFWMGRAPFKKGKLYKLKLVAQEEIGRASCRERV